VAAYTGGALSVLRTSHQPCEVGTVLSCLTLEKSDMHRVKWTHRELVGGLGSSSDH
jgi:hypothetical protein